MDNDDSGSSQAPVERRAATLLADGQRVIAFDVIRCFAIAMVVLFHVVHPLTMDGLRTLPPAQWWIANAFDTFSRVCVPLLVMLSGALLLSRQKTESLSTFFRKRVKRVLIPLLGWAALYLLWRVVVHKEALTPFRALQELLAGTPYSHLWFMYMILGLYLATPVLRVYLNKASERDLWYLVILWFAVTAILPTLDKLFHLSIGIQMTVVTGYAGYFVVGHLLGRLHVPKTLFRILPLLMVGLTAVTAWATYALTITAGGNPPKVDEFFWTAISPTTMLLTFCVFLFLKELPYERVQGRAPGVSQTMSRLSIASLGIYLVHVMVIEILAMGSLGFTLSYATLPPWIGVPTTTAVILILSFVIVSLIQRIPLLRAIV